MADQGENFTKLRKKKRKQRLGEEFQEGVEPSKISRTNNLSLKKIENQETEPQSRQIQVNLEVGSPWRNLHLILLLQNKNIDILRKMEVVFNYVQLRAHKGGEVSCSGVLETVSISRVIGFVSNWIQLVLISSVKKTEDKRCGGQSETSGGLFLDHRCWWILKFCLEESLKLDISLSLSRDFLQVFDCITKDILTNLNLDCIDSKELALTSEFQDIVLNCISLIFTCHGGIQNANLDLWIMVSEKVLELALLVFKNKLEEKKAGLFVLQFSCYLLEPFAKFLTVHPARKNGFHDFIGRLLEPLMYLLDVLHFRACKNFGPTTNLLKLVEEVLLQGIFHPVHMDGFLRLQSAVKFKRSVNGKSKDQPMVIKSYHRHFFDKLEKIIACKNGESLGGIGQLLHLFVNCVTKQKEISSIRVGSNIHTLERTSVSNNMAREEHGFAGAVNSETRKPLFDFFVQIMKYFLPLVNTYIEAEFNAGAPAKDVLWVIRSANKLLAGFKNENIYLHTEDTAEGASINFLRFIYQTVMSFSAKIKHLLLLSISSHNGFPREVLLLIAKEIVVALHHLMDIEYQIVGADLENLWLVMFTFTACNHATVDAPDDQSLSLEILNLGCSLIDLYSELRQVNFSIFSLSKAVRLVASSLTDNEAYPTRFYNSCSTSLVTLICSTEFRLSVWNAIKSIPEGQVSGCIQQLTADTSECLEWLKVQLHLGPGNNLSKLGPADCRFSWFNLKTELLGRVISEIYTLILDSMIVTVGNSNALGHSVEQLKALMCCNSQGGDLLKPDIMDKFFSMISGRTDSQGAVFDNDSLSCWLLVFLFRLYLSCRSLYRQVISLVPPDKSMKMSETMGDPHTAHAGKDWLEGVIKNDEGYFSWIIKPSDTLLSVISYVLNNLQDSLADCPPLVYVLNAMTLQRLVDLNKILNSYEYLLARNDKLVETKVIGDTGIPLLLKRNKKFRKRLLNMKQEAAGLTKFMLSWVSSLVKVPTLLSIQDVHEENAWDLSIGTLNDKSLPSAIGWIVSQHADVWCDHAAKKDLKKFLRLLIRCSLPIEGAGMDRRFMSHHIEKLSHLKTVKTVTTCRISLVLLNDTGLYEQKFFRRHIASVFCHVLEASLTSDSGEGYLDSKPDWSQVVLSLDNLSNGVSNEKCAKNNCASHTDSWRSKQFAPSCNVEYSWCSSLLNFVGSMPRGVLSAKSLLQFATCILNVERVLVGNLLSWHRTLSNGGHVDLFRLFLSCRRTLKSLLMASCDEKCTQDCYLIIFLLSESSFPVLWLLKSITAVIGIPSASSEEFACQMPDILFSLMDHTSYMFLTIGRYQFELAMRFYGIGSDGKHSDANVSPGTDLTEDEPPLSLSSCIDMWRILALLNEILREQVRNFCSRFNERCVSENFGVSPEFLEFKKSSSVMSCIQGFLWGLASGLDGTDAETSKIRVKFPKCNTDPLYKLNILIEECAESLIYLLQLLVLKDEFGQSFAHAQITEVSGSGYSGKAESSGKVDAENCGPIGENGIKNRKSVSDKCAVRGNSCTGNAAVESLLVNVEIFDQQHLKRTLLQDLLRGDNVEVAFFLKQLLLASSAIMRLKLKLNCTSPLENLMPISFGICQVLLSEFASMVSVPPPFSFVLLDGAVKVLAELATFSPILSKELYVKLIDLHLKSIGKCIVLQGKRAVVPSKESESSIKYPLELFNSPDSSQPSGTCYLDDFKARLRMSFRRLVQKSSELHLLSAIQAIERTVVGVREDCLTNYEICAGRFDSGKVTSTVAAGIDCLDLVIEFVTGRKCMNVVKRHIQGLVSCLLNIILHLKGPSIFSECVNCDYGYASPDSGSIVLMCIDILIRVAGKHALFQMDACHVSQFLNIPAALFQNFLQIQLIEGLDKSNSLSNLGALDTCFLKSTSVVVVDQRYSSELYAGCCRLLCTVVKHHTSEAQHCSVLLQHSVSILLHCLEMVKRDSTVSRGSVAWELQDGVKCACCLRRIYEEIRQQKDWIGRYSYQFLSEYIRVYCGCGPLTTGIIREVDEALRPGIYALIDACSDDDLQHLHTVFGEGPLRSCLATLRNDYKLHFQYEGKV